MVRTVLRTAIKVGDSYSTVEMEIVLPLGAMDEELVEAKAQAERQLITLSAVSVPTVKPTPSLMTERQRTKIVRMSRNLPADLVAAALNEQGGDMDTLTKEQASALIDTLTQHEVAVNAAAVNNGDLPF